MFFKITIYPFALFYLLDTPLFAAATAINIAWDAEPRTLDPRYAIDANSQYLADLVHCSLISFDKSGAITPQFAEKWTWDSPVTLTMQLKKNVRFSDGTPVTGKDVKATYDFFKSEKVKTPSPLAPAFKNLTEVKVTGDHSVQFVFSEADASFIQNFMIGILPEKVASGDIITTAEASTGCGPYVIKNKDVSGITLARNEKYSLGQAAKSSAVQIKIVKDELTRFTKLQKGELDIVQNGVSRDKVKDIKNYPNLKVVKKSGIGTTYLGFNFKDPLLKDKRVREAIALAVHRQAIIDYILQGMARSATGMLLPEDKYYNASLPPAVYDPEKAKKLLDDSGFKDPDGNGPKTRMELTYKTTTDITRINIAKAIASQLGKVGIKVNVQSLEWGKFKEDVEKGNVQLWSLSWIGFKDPDIFRYAFATESFPPNGGNRGWYSNPTLDKILATARTTTDFKERKKLYDEVQLLVHAELPYAFLWHEDIFALVRSDVKNYELFADGRYSSLVNVEKR